LFCVLFLPLNYPFHISVQVYRKLPPVKNPIAVNKYHTLCLALYFPVRCTAAFISSNLWLPDDGASTMKYVVSPLDLVQSLTM
jgi:hypothetical protein